MTEDRIRHLLTDVTSLAKPFSITIAFTSHLIASTVQRTLRGTTYVSISGLKKRYFEFWIGTWYGYNRILNKYWDVVSKDSLLCTRHSFIQYTLNCSNPPAPFTSQNQTNIGNEFVVQLKLRVKFVTLPAAINPSDARDISKLDESTAIKNKRQILANIILRIMRLLT